MSIYCHWLKVICYKIMPDGEQWCMWYWILCDVMMLLYNVVLICMYCIFQIKICVRVWKAKACFCALWVDGMICSYVGYYYKYISNCYRIVTIYCNIITDMFILCYIIIAIMLHIIKVLLQICCVNVTDITYLL